MTYDACIAEGLHGNVPQGANQHRALERVGTVLQLKDRVWLNSDNAVARSLQLALFGELHALLT